MYLFARLAIVFAFVTVADPGSVRAQSQERVIYASVLDRSGAPLAGLTASDFLVSENGVQREVLDRLVMHAVHGEGFHAEQAVETRSRRDVHLVGQLVAAPATNAVTSDNRYRGDCR